MQRPLDVTAPGTHLDVRLLPRLIARLADTHGIRPGSDEVLIPNGRDPKCRGRRCSGDRVVDRGALNDDGSASGSGEARSRLDDVHLERRSELSRAHFGGAGAGQARRSNEGD